MTTNMIANPERDVMVKTIVTEEPLTIDYYDIEDRIESDGDMWEAPWENCDGFEHEFHRDSHWVHNGMKDSIGWVGRSDRYGGSGYIEIDDDTVIKWGCTGYPGCSKQARAESIARTKRSATKELVNWYVNGWEYYLAIAEYGDYFECIGGIDSLEYAREVAEDLRKGIADRMERDGYIVENCPQQPKPYNRYDAFRDKIRRQLTL